MTRYCSCGTIFHIRIKIDHSFKQHKQYHSQQSWYISVYLSIHQGYLWLCQYYVGAIICEIWSILSTQTLHFHLLLWQLTMAVQSREINMTSGHKHSIYKQQIIKIYSGTVKSLCVMTTLFMPYHLYAMRKFQWNPPVYMKNINCESKAFCCLFSHKSPWIGFAWRNWL